MKKEINYLNLPRRNRYIYRLNTLLCCEEQDYNGEWLQVFLIVCLYLYCRLGSNFNTTTRVCVSQARIWYPSANVVVCFVSNALRWEVLLIFVEMFTCLSNRFYFNFSTPVIITKNIEVSTIWLISYVWYVTHN